MCLEERGLFRRREVVIALADEIGLFGAVQRLESFVAAEIDGVYVLEEDQVGDGIEQRAQQRRLPVQRLLGKCAMRHIGEEADNVVFAVDVDRRSGDIGIEQCTVASHAGKIGNALFRTGGEGTEPCHGLRPRLRWMQVLNAKPQKFVGRVAEQRTDCRVHKREG